MAIVLGTVSALERFLAALAQVQRAEGVPGVRAIYDLPPENLAALPALVNSASGGSWEEPGWGDVPTGLQHEVDVFEVYVFSDQSDAQRARAQLLPVKDALRRLINRHKAMRETCRQCRVTTWRMGVLEFAEQQYHGCIVSGEVRLDLAGEFAA
jgi:hypothetical protein